eukprot:11946827-Alexandrium_andersonii.AAC.1
MKRPRPLQGTSITTAGIPQPSATNIRGASQEQPPELLIPEHRRQIQNQGVVATQTRNPPMEQPDDTAQNACVPNL